MFPPAVFHVPSSLSETPRMEPALGNGTNSCKHFAVAFITTPVQVLSSLNKCNVFLSGASDGCVRNLGFAGEFYMLLSAGN